MSSQETRGDIGTSPSLIELRRALHQKPELRFALDGTAALVRERLLACGWEVRSGIAQSGMLATLASALPGPHIALRADMDAMPVDDAKDVPYASTVPGAMHACGHDVHTTVLVGVAERLASGGLPSGRVSLIFQPAEEIPYGEASGALTMLDEGVFRDGQPDAVLAWHSWPSLPVGSMGIDDRIAMAGKDAFHVVLRGRPAHAATPSRGRDAILGMAQLISALHQAVARSLDASDMAAFNVGTVHGGASQSVIAARTEITGTIRTIDDDLRHRLREVVERNAAGVAMAAGLEHEVTWADIVPAVVNDDCLAARAIDVGTRLLGSARVERLSTPPMTADDFAFFTNVAPGLYMKLGVCGAERCAPLHNSDFDVDERAIGVGVGILHELTLDLIERPIEQGERA